MRSSSASSPVSCGGLGAAGQLDRPLGAADTALAVGDQRQQRRLAAHPAGGAQFGERLRPVAAVVGGDADGFADRGDPAGAGTGGPGVRQRGLGIVVEEFAGGHQMPRDDVGGAAVQSGEFAADLRAPAAWLRCRRDRRAASRSSASCRACGWARRARPGPELRGGRPLIAAARCPPALALDPPRTAFAAAALPVLGHVCLSDRARCSFGKGYGQNRLAHNSNAIRQIMACDRK